MAKIENTNPPPAHQPVSRPLKRKREPRQPWNSEQHHAFLVALQDENSDTASVPGRSRDQFISHKQSYMHLVRRVLKTAEATANIDCLDLNSVDGRARIPYFISQCYAGFLEANKKRLALFNTPESMARRIQEYLGARGVMVGMEAIMQVDSAPRVTNGDDVLRQTSFETLYREQQKIVTELEQKVGRLETQLAWKVAAARYNGATPNTLAPAHPVDPPLTGPVDPQQAARTYEAYLTELDRAMLGFDFPTVLTLGSAMVAAYPNRHKPYLYRAAACSMLGRREAACSDFMKAIQLKPECLATDMAR